jgi:23S rRNA (cytosine1962-C5)-methyltransferase
VVQFTSLAMARRRELLAELLTETLRPRGIYLRTERGIGDLEGLELQDGLLAGEPPPSTLSIEENGLAYRVNLAEGQKTGFYFDQRENRAAVAPLARGRSVLDGFCYSGGFGLACARAGAAEVEGVDVSEAAIRLAEENAALNGLANVRFRKADVFADLDRLAREGRKFGMVVLDPPKFARTRKAIPEALRGYRRLYTLGLRLLEPDGILVVCCCSGSITHDMLDELLAQVAVEERRDVQLLRRLGQSPDHPVAVTCPETAYLKCLICRVGA